MKAVVYRKTNNQIDTIYTDVNVEKLKNGIIEGAEGTHSNVNLQVFSIGLVDEDVEINGDTIDGLDLLPVPESDEQRITRLEEENAFLALELATAQARLDQTEQEQAELLLLLVSEGVI